MMKKTESVNRKLPVQSLAKSTQNSWLSSQAVHHLATCLLSYLPDIAQCLQRKMHKLSLTQKLEFKLSTHF